MKNTIIILIIALFLVNFVMAAMPPAEPFCIRQGYKIQEIEEEQYCVFDDGKKCQIWDFFNGNCGRQYIKESACVPLGEPVFSFEECCEGRSYLPPGMMGQATCTKFSETFSGKALLIGLVLLAIIIMIILLIIFLKKKKRKNYK